ncbi:TraB/GumN family protein [Thiococcus pfennigii]|uniref:TraB/GumN family protein n=1 Tax=Thiococcus pfennigii TaxID=1057 RepID=UPI001902F5DE|nr:TraB/GumN family protein [Thiococcus pfennigii]MBK1702050.1 conjugal transfer protein TraB [Thiococcus pfennigii]MBK1732930.1 conjugal transfer protein TraB [Thiococcus pfennigii]
MPDSPTSPPDATAGAAANPGEPRVDLSLAGAELTLLGTAHVSRASADMVRRLIEEGQYDAVAVELCRSRYSALIDPASLSRMDLFSVIREGRVYMVVASLALSAYQQRLADQFGIEAGAEQRTAVRMAQERDLPLLLIDREVGITLRRLVRNMGWWRRYSLFVGLVLAMVSREDITEEEIERLKEGDVLETTFAELAEDRRDLFIPLIDERDRYMAAKLRTEIAEKGYRRLLAVVGAGHLDGVARHLRGDTGDQPAETVRALEEVPPPSRWPRRLPWLVVAVILAGFLYGFAKSPALGLEMLVEWVLINGTLAAGGAALAGGHPLTVLAAFAAAPLTSLNPTIGVGLVTAGVELSLRRPSVGDFSRLRTEVTRYTGWWRNRVARIFLVFMLSTLGSVIGTYVAGFRIFEKLF